MKYYNTVTTDRIGYDFYCDVADRMVAGRKRKNWTQNQLAEAAEISLSRISAMEAVKIRFTLPDVEKLAKALGVSVDWLIDAQLDHHGKDCRYLVWNEKVPGSKFYQDASSSHLAFLKMCERIKGFGVRFLEPRDRAIVKLVGVPIEKAEIQARFPKLSGKEDETIEPDEEAAT